MKTTGISFTALVIIFSAFTARSEDEYIYSELFEEGKTWNVVDEYYDYVTDKTTTVHKQISIGREWRDGDHMPRELNCFDQQSGTSSFYSYLEENRAIYTKGSNSYRRLIDFNLRKGDTVEVQDGEDGIEGSVVGRYYVVNDEIVDIRGIRRRILSIGSEKDGSPFTYWIEGIGSIWNWVMLSYPEPTCSPFLKNSHITSCFLNGECIFSHEDLEDYIARSGVEIPAADKMGEGRLSYSGDTLKVVAYIGNVSVNVCSTDGTLCISEKLTDSYAISTSTLPAGCYFALAVFLDGSASSLKFIKK